VPAHVCLVHDPENIALVVSIRIPAIRNPESTKNRPTPDHPTPIITAKKRSYAVRALDPT
jgi:hypothetical protein